MSFTLEDVRIDQGAIEKEQYRRQEYTLPGYGDRETEVENYFDGIVAAINRKNRIFSDCLKEVRGRFVFTPKGMDDSKTPRLDRVLIPAPELIDAGWTHGPIGVELKASGKKVGRPIAQILDYKRAEFELSPGYHTEFEWMFLFPFQEGVCGLGSVMCQNRIGALSFTRGTLTFNVSGTMAIIYHMRTGHCRARTMKTGLRRGSR